MDYVRKPQRFNLSLASFGKLRTTCRNLITRQLQEAHFWSNRKLNADYPGRQFADGSHASELKVSIVGRERVRAVRGGRRAVGRQEPMAA
jgi:hypothetical protein